MAFRAVLDACVLFPVSLRDTLLRLAEREFFDLVWSEQILDEMERNLVGTVRTTQAQAQGLRTAMQAAFPEASVDAEAIAALEPAMTNDPKDRHVLAAAVAGHAEVVVTANLRDFPEAACAPLSVEAQSPDEFLGVLFDLNPTLVAVVLHEQAADLKRPPMTLNELLDSLEAAGVPQFAESVRRLEAALGA